jgi:hypothetical protein
MTDITVTTVGTVTYKVVVTDDTSSTNHMVTVDPDDLVRYGAATDPTGLVEASFRFLLDREPKESILGRFELRVIPKYFPEYKDRISEYL